MAVTLAVNNGIEKQGFPAPPDAPQIPWAEWQAFPYSASVIGSWWNQTSLLGISLELIDPSPSINDAFCALNIRLAYDHPPPPALDLPFHHFLCFTFWRPAATRCAASWQLNPVFPGKAPVALPLTGGWGPHQTRVSLIENYRGSIML